MPRFDTHLDTNLKIWFTIRYVKLDTDFTLRHLNKVLAPENEKRGTEHTKTVPVLISYIVFVLKQSILTYKTVNHIKK